MTRHANKLVLLLAALLAGCQSQAANVVEMNADGGTMKVQVLNEGLQEELEIIPLKVAYEGDIMMGRVKVRNHEDEKLPFEYRWKWFDADGLQVEVGGAGDTWAKKWANPLEEVEVDGHATKEGAVRTEFHLRYAAE